MWVWLRSAVVAVLVCGAVGWYQRRKRNKTSVAVVVLLPMPPFHPDRDVTLRSVELAALDGIEAASSDLRAILDSSEGEQT